MPAHPSATPSHFWKGQIAHAVLLVALIAAAWSFVDPDELAMRQLFGVSARVWFIIALLIPVLHQLFVWIAWRTELCFGAITKRFGDLGFSIYLVVFFLLFFSRPIVLIFLTVADHDSMEISVPVRTLLCVVLGIPAAYTGYSVVRYFGMSRAAGGDHFDERYRTMPLVKEGIFKYTSNSMYTFAFLALSMIAIAGGSWSALVAAAFSHVYIWVHYFCTERPDMRMIYS